MSTKAKNITAWIITGLLAVGFIFSGYIKISGNPEMANNFERWGYPLFFMYIVGIIEWAGAIGLLFKKTRPWSAFVLLILMVGAIGTHLVNNEVSMIGAAAFNLLLLIALLWLRKNEWQYVMRNA